MAPALGGSIFTDRWTKPTKRLGASGRTATTEARTGGELDIARVGPPRVWGATLLYVVLRGLCR
jgi:hypothetical protein